MWVCSSWVTGLGSFSLFVYAICYIHVFMCHHNSVLVLHVLTHQGESIYLMWQVSYLVTHRFCRQAPITFTLHYSKVCTHALLFNLCRHKIGADGKVLSIFMSHHLKSSHIQCNSHYSILIIHGALHKVMISNKYTVMLQQ